ncbi:MAG: C4-dicarboxylate ABC transporter permease [Rhodobacteraceae bacterium]|nr:C4-dicarboxylate ABC transporter permease [Paracoccaceae bacterium]
MIELIASVFLKLALAAYHVGYALVHPGLWLDWSDNQSLMRFVYYGASSELLYVFLLFLIILTGCGLWRRSVMWGAVRTFEAIGNWIGRTAAWAGLIMVVQQVVIIALQRIFRVAEISVGPFGYVFSRDLSWFGEELKLYNAMIVCLCCSYTFIQGGHVRVDLVYSAISHRAKRCIDMAGALLFMLPAMLLLWLYAWFFMWRHLIVPKPSASDSLERLLAKSRAVRWNVETIGFSPNGFDAYFLFKVLLVIFTSLIILQTIAFFFRSILEFREGPDSVGRHADCDTGYDTTTQAAAK